MKIFSSVKSIHFVYVPCPSKSVARKISTQILKEKLAGCTNLLPQMESQYWWKGKLETSQEVVLIFKTTIAKLPSLRERLLQIHPYDTPCIADFKVHINSSYQLWLETAFNHRGLKN